jgi:HK97 family phage major capsid protein
MSPSVFEKLIQLADAGNNVIYLDNARDKPAMVLFGIPVVVTEKLPALNTAGDVILCDFRHYLVGNRQDVDIAFSEHYRFANNQGAWRFLARVDGQPWLRDKITLADAATTMTPFVGLAAG